jgi:uncharacterized protein
MTAPPTAQRAQLVDALRILALMGVFVVNLVSYANGPWGGPLPAASPDGSLAAAIAVGIVAALFQNKAYPLLAFLFGYSLQLSLRTKPDQSAFERFNKARSRHRRMGVMGLLHGFLIFSGDILTVYALSGMLLLQVARWRIRRLLWLLLLPFVVWMTWVVLGVAGRDLAEPAAERYATLTTFGGHLAINASAFTTTLAFVPFGFLPEVFVYMTLGLITARLRVLEQPARWQTGLRSIVTWWLPAGIALNVVYGVFAATIQFKHWPFQYALLSAGSLIGPTLTVGAVAWLCCQWNRPQSRVSKLLKFIAPAGRNTLSMYVGLSCAMLLALSGAGLGWARNASTQALLGGAIAAYAVAAGLSWWAASRQTRGPLEAWLHHQ